MLGGTKAAGSGHAYEEIPTDDIELSEDGTPVHRANQIWKPCNLAIVMSYFAIGFAMSFISTPLNIYMINELNAEPPMQATIGILQTLPWSLKLCFGFLSDVVPINGAHRKPYLVIGAVLYSGSFILFSLFGFQQNSIILLAVTIFFGTLGLIMMDVMADTMVCWTFILTLLFNCLIILLSVC